MKSQNKICLFLLFFFTINVFCQTKLATLPRTHTAYKTNFSINIDGKVNESIWEKANWTSNFIDIEGVDDPKYQTKIKMLWDEDFFYILADIKEPNIWADITERDAIIFHNNNFEIFLDPNGNTHNYYEIEINALNTIWDLFLTKPYRELNSSVINDWNITGLKSAIGINGTLNNPNDIDKGWIVEMAIPWSAFKTSYFQDIVPRNQFWRVNFSRVNWNHTIDKNGTYSRKKNKEDSKYLKEFNWVWSPQGVINMHEPEKWGYVLFSSKNINDINLSDSNTFNIPKDEQIKYTMYNLHRKQNRFLKKNKAWIQTMDELIEKDFVIDNKKIKLKLELHKTGYNIFATSPFSNKEFILTEDGELLVN